MTQFGYYAHFKETDESLADVVRAALGPFETHAAWRRQIAAVAARSFILDPDQIAVGWPIVLKAVADDERTQVPIAYDDLLQMHRLWCGASPAERDIFLRNWDLLEWVHEGALSGAQLRATNGATACVGQPFAAATVAPLSARSEAELWREADLLSSELVRRRQHSRSCLAHDLADGYAFSVIRVLPDVASGHAYARRLEQLLSIARSSRQTARGIRRGELETDEVDLAVDDPCISAIGIGFPVAASQPWLFRASARSRPAQGSQGSVKQASRLAAWVAVPLSPLQLPTLGRA